MCFDFYVYLLFTFMVQNGFLREDMLVLVTGLSVAMCVRVPLL